VLKKIFVKVLAVSAKKLFDVQKNAQKAASKKVTGLSKKMGSPIIRPFANPSNNRAAYGSKHFETFPAQ
jgi:hypothetical protein